MCIGKYTGYRDTANLATGFREYIQKEKRVMVPKQAGRLTGSRVLARVRSGLKYLTAATAGKIVAGLQKNVIWLD